MKDFGVFGECDFCGLEMDLEYCSNCDKYFCDNCSSHYLNCNYSFS